MHRIRPWWFALATLASFLAVGIPYWRISYHDLNLPSALMTPWLLLAMALALLLCFTRAAPFWLAAPMIAVVVIAVVMVRMHLDTARDPTSHNLWPIEVVIALGVGFAAALPVAIAGGVAGLLRSKSRNPKPSR